jgi:hypothetical protein
MVGLYFDLVGVLRGFANDGGIFSNVDFPGASGTQVIGVNDAGQMVGDYFDAASVEHGFVSSGGTFTAIDFMGPPGPRPPGSMPPATSSEDGRMQRDSTGFCTRPACSPRSTFRSRPARPRSASTTPGRSPAFTATPLTTATASSTPAVLQHRRRCRRPQHSPDTYQEWRSGYGRLL